MCLTDSQCGAGELCLAGTCTSNAVASVIGKVEGAPGNIAIQSQAVGDEVCTPHAETGLVCTLAAGGRVVLVAPAVDGYHFTGWTGAGCDSDEATLELAQVNVATVCVAHYAQRVQVRGTVADNPTLLVRASSDSAGATCGDGSCQVDTNDVVTLEAPLRDGYRITAFDGDGCSDRDAYRVTVKPTQGDVTCVARYVESLTVRGQLQGLEPSVSARVMAQTDDPAGVCTDQLCGVSSGAAVTLVAPQVDGYRFRGWTGDAPCLGADPTLLIQDVTQNVLCTADYVRRFQVLGVADSPDGQLANAIAAQSPNLFSVCSGASCVVDQGEDVTLLAGTVAGYRFSAWAGLGCQTLSGGSGLAAAVLGDTVCTALYAKGVAVSGTVVDAVGEVTAMSSSSGAVCAHGSCAIDVGGAVALTAPNLPGRTFLGWSGDDGCSGSALTIALSDVATSKSCRARFAPRYTATGSAAPSQGGVVSASASAPNASCAGPSCTVDQGASVQLEAAPNPRFRFTGWSGGGPCAGSATRLTLTNLQSSVSCRANFVARIQVSGAVTPAKAGSVSALQLTLSSDCQGATCTVDAGSDVFLSASPAAGFSFSSWSGCGSPLSSLLGGATLPVLGATADTTCTAHFKRLSYVVTALAGTGGSVAASTAAGSCPGAMCAVDYGDSAVLSATPSVGYTFSDWGTCGSGSPLTLANVRMTQSCTASFARIRVALSGVASPANAGNIVASSPSAGAACTGAGCTVDYGSAVQLQAGPAVGYRFGGWSGCNDAQLSGSSLRIDNLTRTRSCQADYIKQWTVRGSSTSGGSVACVGSCVVDNGGSATLQASPGPGQYLVGWSCANSTADTLTLSNVTADISCVATFSDIPG